ncbi:MAG: hypothetical protein ACMUIP_06615 [bacterium]
MTAHSQKQLKPKCVLPFKITRQNGLHAFQQWIRKLWFAPNDLKRRARHEEKLTGIYVPYWTYDSDTTSFYRGQQGIYYWENETYTTVEDGRRVTRTRRVRKIRWYPVSGTVWESFNDILVLASHSLPPNYTRQLEPWDLEHLVPYKDEYLSGFRAESYNIDLERGFEKAKNIMDFRIKDLIEQDIGGDEQRIDTSRTHYSNIMFKHILLPVWISAYRYGKKIYRFLINGRTGEVQGERPWSWVKITSAVLTIVAIVAAIVYLTLQFR